MNWKNRIVEQRMVPIADLKANPQNWRLHPASQRAALDELLGKVGVVQGVIYNKRTERLIDGHLRLDMAEKAGVDALPVTVVDLSEEEERLVLATLDPIGAMATHDEGKLQELIGSIERKHDALISSVVDALNSDASQKLDPLFSRESDEWETPGDLFEQLNSEFDFTVDVAATKQNAKCKRYWTKGDDGLAQDWTNERVWCNPPYSNVNAWVEKAALSDAISVLLIPARTDTQWFHRYIWSRTKNESVEGVTVRLLSGRIKFLGPGGKLSNSAPFPAMVVVFRPKRLPSPEKQNTRGRPDGERIVEILCSDGFLESIMPTLESWGKNAKISIA